MVERIKRLCKQKGVTFIQFERESGIGEHTVARWGRVAPSIHKVKQAADYFGVSVSYLLGETSNPATERDGAGINPHYYDLSAEDRAAVDALIERLAKAPQ